MSRIENVTYELPDGDVQSFEIMVYASFCICLFLIVAILVVNYLRLKNAEIIKPSPRYRIKPKAGAYLLQIRALPLIWVTHSSYKTQLAAKAAMNEIISTHKHTLQFDKTGKEI